MEKKIIVWIPLGDMMHEGNREMSQAIYNRCLMNADWWAHRADIMSRYTIPSLLSQLGVDFKVLATIRPETRKLAKPVIKELKRVKATVSELLPKDRALIRAGRGADLVVAIHMDSDDMYGPTAVAQMAGECREPGDVAILKDGIYYDDVTGKMAAVTMPGPPFFAKAYSREALKSEAAIAEFRKEKGLQRYHHQMLGCPGVTQISGPKFCQLIHGENTTTAWDNPHTKNKITRMVVCEKEKAEILKWFGVKR